MSTPKSLWIHCHLKQTLCKYFTVDRKRMKTKPVPRPHLPCNPCLHCWLTEFAVVNLNLTWWIWICRSELEFAEVKLNLPWRIEICHSEFEIATVDMNLPWWIWNCLKWIWICRGEFDVINLPFPRWIWICRVNLNLPWWIWNCRKWIWIWCGEFEFAVVNLNLP